MSDIAGRIHQRMPPQPDQMTRTEARIARERLLRNAGLVMVRPGQVDDSEWEQRQTELEAELDQHIEDCRNAEWMMHNARSSLCAQNPEIAASVLRIEWFVDPYYEGLGYATTTQIAVGAGFARLLDSRGEKNLMAQMGLLAHEVMHVALRHSERGSELMQKHEHVPHKLMNICADVLINEALVRNHFELPPAGIRWCHYQSLAPEDHPVRTRSGPTGETFETLTVAAADWLREAAEANENESGQEPGNGTGGADNEEEKPTRVALDPDHGPSETRELRAAIEAEARRRVERSGAETPEDVRTGRAGRTGENAKANAVARALHNASRMSAAAERSSGSGLGNTLRTLAEIDAKPIDWRRELDACAKRAFSPERKRSRILPSKRTLAEIARSARTGRGIVISRKRIRVRKRGTLHVGFDTSGSIDDPRLGAFITHGAQLAAQHGASLLFTLSDDGIRHESVIESAGRTISSIRTEMHQIAQSTRGGGGTSFVPVTNIARERGVDMTIFYTDLWGAFDPVAPKIPMVWCVPQTEHGYEEPPYGRLLMIDA